MIAKEGSLRAHEMDGKELHDAAEFLRGKIRPVAVDVDDAATTDRRARKAHFDWYRQTRRNALALWVETVDLHDHPTSSGDASAGSEAAASGVASTSLSGWPDDGSTSVPCLLWCSGRWHCASAGWSAYPEKETLKVVFVGYDEEDAVFVHPQDARIRQAVLDPRRGRDNPNHQVLKGIFPKEGDFVRLHVVDAAEARVFLQQGVFLAGVVASPLAAHDSSLVRAVGLAGAGGGLLVVPNTRMDHVSAQEFARVVERLKVARNQVLRQLDIATSQTIAIRVVSEVGEVADDRAEISIWALGDQMLVRVWQRKGEFMLDTSVPASDGLAAVGLEDAGLTVLSEGERKQLLGGVIRRLRLSRGRLTMATEVDYTPGGQATQHHEEGGIPVEIYQETHTVEGVLVKTTVEPAGFGDSLRVRSQTMPPGPERVYDIIAQPEDWAALGYPSLPWLNGKRASSLGQQLTRCVGAREGCLVLQIGRRILRCRDWFPMPPSPGGNASKRARSTPKAATSKTRERSNNQTVNGDASSCVSGAEPGLCSCRVVLKKGVALPLSIAEPTAATVEDKDGNNNNNITPASSGSRWLVVVKAAGEKLTLSLIQPSRRAPSSSIRPSTTSAITASLRAMATSGASGAHKLHQRSKRREMRRSLSLAATWGDWAHLGYGPLPWLSHEQKAFIARLSLYWVSIPLSLSRSPETPIAIERLSSRDRTQDPTKAEVAPHHGCKEAFLRYRPIICSLTRAVGSSRKMLGRTALHGDDGCSPVGAGTSGTATATPHAEENSKIEKASASKLVLVRDEGSVFRVEVAGVGSEGEASRCRGGLTRLENTFGKEAWLGTGLGELLWMDCSSRQYLAHRLAQQVAFTTAEEGESREGCQDRGECNKTPAALVIVSDLPLPYWRGTVKIARLGSHAEGVFVKITDAGRRLRIEAEDFEGGPRLASSLVALEAWTVATGIATLRPPTNSHSFRKILEDKLAALLGAGYRSRTSRLEKKRLSKGTTQQRDGGGRRWRGTFLQLSEMEKGEIGKSEGDGGASDTGDFGTPLQVKQAQTSLSPRDLTALEQKRALRLEMLTRMIEEFHAKHGRRHRGGAKRSRNKIVGLRVPAAPTSATAADPGGQNHDLVREGATAAAGTAGGTDESGRINIASTTTTRIESNDSMSANDNNGDRRSSNSNNNGDVLLPVLAPPTTCGRTRHSESKTEGPLTLSLRGSTPSYSYPDPPLAPAKDVSGCSSDVRVHGSGVTAALSNQVTPLHICVCCGGEGGRGHGRRCEHIFRRCGFCRVDEVKRILGIRDPHGRTGGDPHKSELDRTGACVPTLLPSKDDGRASGAFDAREEAQEEEDEFEWVTDSEEDDPEFQCDSCGRVIEETADRFHCEVCGDHDSCQACFFSSRKAASGQHGVQEGGAGGEHLASHDVTRIIGNPALPDR